MVGGAHGERQVGWRRVRGAGGGGGGALRARARRRCRGTVTHMSSALSPDERHSAMTARRSSADERRRATPTHRAMHAPTQRAMYDEAAPLPTSAIMRGRTMLPTSLPIARTLRHRGRRRAQWLLADPQMTETQGTDMESSSVVKRIHASALMASEGADEASAA